MSRTKGRYVLETIPTEQSSHRPPTIFVGSSVEQAARRILSEWSEMGCPRGEFLIEFAERESEDE